MDGLGRVGVGIQSGAVGISSNEFSGGVLDCNMAPPGDRFAIGRQSIGRDNGITGNPIMRGAADGGDGMAGDTPKYDRPATLDHRQNQWSAWAATGPHAARAAAMWLARRGAGINLIHLHDARENDALIGHHCSDAMSKMPGDFVCDAEHLRELSGGNAL